MLSLTSCVVAQCPPQGSAHNPNKATDNILKNREITFLPITPITLSQILADGPDQTSFSNTTYTQITGYVIDFKQGGKESCNCGTLIDSLNDTHLYIGLTPYAKKSDCMIAEITPRFKHLNKINPANLVGKQITIEGFLFFDSEHIPSAKNTCTTCLFIWRKTCTEIHPITKITIVTNK